MDGMGRENEVIDGERKVMDGDGSKVMW